MNTMQTVVHGGYLVVREPRSAAAGLRHWRSSSRGRRAQRVRLGRLGVALALENAAKVRTLGQVELLFTFAVSHWWLHERHTRDASTPVRRRLTSLARRDSRS